MQTSRSRPSRRSHTPCSSCEPLSPELRWNSANVGGAGAERDLEDAEQDYQEREAADGGPQQALDPGVRHGDTHRAGRNGPGGREIGRQAADARDLFRDGVDDVAELGLTGETVSAAKAEQHAQLVDFETAGGVLRR